MKKCSKCKEIKSYLSFSKNVSTKDGKEYSCKTCHSARFRRYKANNKAKVQKQTKRANLKRKYGLTLEAYEEMLIRHSNRCAICATLISDLTLQGSYICVDHNHVTGKVRGLLCNDCNQGLGRFKDNLLIIDNAKLYLELDGCY